MSVMLRAEKNEQRFFYIHETNVFFNSINDDSDDIIKIIPHMI